MVGIKIQTRITKVDVAKWKKEFEAYMADLLIEAARAFVRAAASRVPVETGMARGSFLNLGAFVNERIPIRIRRNRNNGTKIYGHEYKNPQAGADKADFKLTNRTFTFSTDVEHFFQDRFVGNSPKSPWGSIAAGQRAFERVMKAGLKKAPNPVNYKIRVKNG